MINIQDIIPFMKKGWVAMDKSGEWWWYSEKPYIEERWWDNDDKAHQIKIFDIAPADDWTKSLIKVDNTAREKFEKEYLNNILKTIKELKQDD